MTLQDRVYHFKKKLPKVGTEIENKKIQASGRTKRVQEMSHDNKKVKKKRNCVMSNANLSA